MLRDSRFDMLRGCESPLRQMVSSLLLCLLLVIIDLQDVEGKIGRQMAATKAVIWLTHRPLASVAIAMATGLDWWLGLPSAPDNLPPFARATNSPAPPSTSPSNVGSPSSSAGVLLPLRPSSRYKEIRVGYYPNFSCGRLTSKAALFRKEGPVCVCFRRSDLKIHIIWPWPVSLLNFEDRLTGMSNPLLAAAKTVTFSRLGVPFGCGWGTGLAPKDARLAISSRILIAFRCARKNSLISESENRLAHTLPAG